DEPAVVDVVLHAGHDEPQAVLLHDVVTEGDDLVEVVARVDVQQREGHGGGPERLDGQVQQQRGVLAAGEEDHGTIELARYLPEDVDGFRLQRGEIVARS